MTDKNKSNAPLQPAGLPAANLIGRLPRAPLRAADKTRKNSSAYNAVNIANQMKANPLLQKRGNAQSAPRSRKDSSVASRWIPPGVRKLEQRFGGR